MILVFGSLNMDLVLRVPALPRPGETVLCDDYVAVPGGKGNNQAVAAARAGAEVMMVGCVGEDEFGRRLLDNLRANGVGTTAVRTSDRPTGVAYICVDTHGENCIVVASGANLDARATAVPESMLGLGAATVLLQMEVPLEETWALIRHAHEDGARIVLNVAPAQTVPRTLLTQVDVLVVNQIEAVPTARALGLRATDPPDLALALARAGHLTCIVTLGHEGAVAARGDELWTVQGMELRPVDTTGAGDAFTGILAACLDADRPLPDALHRAAVGAGLTCLGLGAQQSLPTAAAIEKNLSRVTRPQRTAAGAAAGKGRRH